MSGDPYRVRPDAVALGASRVLPNDDARNYTPITFPRDPRAGCQMYVRRAAIAGLLPTSECPEPYAILDVYDANGDIVQDFAIPHRRCFRFLYTTLGWRVERPGTEDGDE